MNKIFRIMLCFSALLVAVAVASAQDQDQPKFESPAKMSLQNVPGLPNCAKAAPTKGDPTKEAAVLYAKLTAGCKVPMHWHTASEQLVIVSGTARMEHQGGQPETVARGGYVMMPGKHQHSFACAGPCEFYIVTDGAFDIHYVDAQGNEIPADQALKSANTGAGKKKAKAGM
jgi:quercetin dioxygenase-like cupin family protein